MALAPFGWNGTAAATSDRFKGRTSPVPSPIAEADYL